MRPNTAVVTVWRIRNDLIRIPILMLMRIRIFIRYGEKTNFLQYPTIFSLNLAKVVV